MICPACKCPDTLQYEILVESKPNKNTMGKSDEILSIASPVYAPTQKLILKACAKCGCAYIVKEEVGKDDVI